MEEHISMSSSVEIMADKSWREQDTIDVRKDLSDCVFVSALINTEICQRLALTVP